MANTTPQKDPAKKAERKKPVRKAPVQKDYPNKLAWLKAMTEFEEAETEKANAAKVARLDKRIQSVTEQIGELRTKLDALTHERAELTGHGHEGEPADAGMPEAADA